MHLHSLHLQHLVLRVCSLFVRAPVSHQGSERGCRSRKPRRQPARTVGWRLAPDLRPRLSPKPLCPTSAQTPDLCFDALPLEPRLCSPREIVVDRSEERRGGKEWVSTCKSRWCGLI